MTDRRRYWRCLGCGRVLGFLPRRWCRDCADARPDATTERNRT